MIVIHMLPAVDRTACQPSPASSRVIDDASESWPTVYGARVLLGAARDGVDVWLNDRVAALEENAI